MLFTILPPLLARYTSKNTLFCLRGFQFSPTYALQNICRFKTIIIKAMIGYKMWVDGHILSDLTDKKGITYF